MKAKYWTKYDPTQDGWYIVKLDFGYGYNEWRGGKWVARGKVTQRTVECYPDEASIERAFTPTN